VATEHAIKLLSTSSWETIWEKRDDILGAVIASGKISEMDATRFQSSPEEWEAEIKYIWSELQLQAAAGANKVEL
jgi:hypothetical protein